VTKISSEWLFNKNYDTQNSTTKNNLDEENKQMEVDCDKLLLDALKGKPKSFIGKCILKTLNFIKIVVP